MRTEETQKSVDSISNSVIMFCLFLLNIFW